MKLILCAALLFTAACTKAPPTSPTLSLPTDEIFTMEMAPSTINLDIIDGQVDAVVSDGSVSIPFGDVLLNAKATKRITIFAKKEILNLDISGFKNASTFKFKYSNCPSSLKRLRDCVVDMELAPQAQPGLLQENISFSSTIFDLNANIMGQNIQPSVPGQLTIIENSLNLGDYFGIQTSGRITILNKSSDSLPVVISPAIFPNSDFTYYSYCPAELRRMFSCQIEFYYNSIIEHTSDTIKTNPISIGSKPIVISVNHKAKLPAAQVNPTISTSTQVTLTEPQTFSSSVTFINQGSTEFTGPTQVLTSHPGITITYSNCRNGLRRLRSCIIYYTLKSDSLPLGTSTQKIRIKNEKSVSADFTIPIIININPNTGTGPTPIVIDPGTGEVIVVPETPPVGSPGAEIPIPPNIPLPPDLNCVPGSSYDPETKECKIDYYTVSTSYNDEYLGETMVPIEITKNGVLCSEDCLDSFQTGDVVKILTGSNTFTSVTDYTITGNRALESIKANELTFKITDDNVAVKINLMVGDGPAGELPPTPAPIPTPDGGVASIRCYTYTNALALKGAFKVETNAEITSYILSAPVDEVLDISVVNGNDNPKYYGFIKHEEDILQCYNFSTAIAPPAPGSTCEQRMQQAVIPNKSLCAPRPTETPVDGTGAIEPSVGVDLCTSLKICSSSVPPDITEAFSKVKAWVKHATGIKTCSPSITCTLPKCRVKCKRWGCKVKCSGGGCRVKTCVSISDVTGAINKVTDTISKLEKAINICSASNNPCGNAFQTLQTVAQQVKDLYNANIGPLRISGVPGTRDIINELGRAHNTAVNTIANVNRESVQFIAEEHKKAVDGISFIHADTVAVATNIHREAVQATASVHNNLVNEITEAHNFAAGKVTAAHTLAVNKIAEENQSFIQRLGDKAWEYVSAGGVFTAAIIETVGGAVLTNIKNNATGIKSTFDDTVDTVVKGAKDTYNFSKDAFKDTLNALVVGFKQGIHRVQELPEGIENLKQIANDFHDTMVSEMTRESADLADTAGIVNQQAASNIAGYHQIAVDNFAVINNQGSNLITEISTGNNPLINDLVNQNNLIMQTMGGTYLAATAIIDHDYNQYVQWTKENLAKAVKAISDIKIRITGDYNPFDNGTGFKISTQFFCSVGLCRTDGSIGMPGTPASEFTTPRSLTINYNNSVLAQQLDPAFIFKNGEHCTGPCLSDFRGGDIVIVFIDSMGPLIRDIKGNVPFLPVILHNGLAFEFEDKDTIIDVFLDPNPDLTDLTGTVWNTGTITTKTRDCTSQPQYSTGGYESSTSNFEEFTSCSAFICTDGTQYSSGTNTCNMVGCNLSTANIDYATAVAGSLQTGCYPTSCSTGYMPAGNICVPKNCSELMTTAELSAMGISISNSNGQIKGNTFPNCSLGLDACNSTHYLLSSEKSCELRTVLTLSKDSIDYITTSSGPGVSASGNGVSSGNSILPIFVGGVTASGTGASFTGTGLAAIAPSPTPIVNATISTLSISGHANKPITACDLDTILATPCSISGSIFTQSFETSELVGKTSVTFIVNELTTEIPISVQNISQISNTNLGDDFPLEPVKFSNFNNELYFYARNSFGIFKMHKVTTEGNIIQVSNTRNANATANKNDDISFPTVYSSHFYFNATNTSNLNKLMRLDSAGNIYQVSNLVSIGSYNDYIYSLTLHNGELYFGGLTDISNNNKLFKTNGSNFTQLSNIRGNGVNDNVGNITSAGADLYFSALNINGFYKIFKLNVDNSITQVSDMRVNANDIAATFTGISAKNSSFAYFNGEVYFPGFNATGRSKLFKITTGGSIVQLSNIWNNSNDNPTSLKVFNNELYFNALTAPGLVKVHKINTNGDISQVTNLRNGNHDDAASFTIFKNELYFSAINESGFSKIYKINSKRIITQVTNLRPSDNDVPPSNIMNMIVVGDSLYFPAYNSNGNIKLFKLSVAP